MTTADDQRPFGLFADAGHADSGEVAGGPRDDQQHPQPRRRRGLRAILARVVLRLAEWIDPRPVCSHHHQTQQEPSK